ncbi:serine hydrolase domain-containing protein [Virgisporangium ochraceum]|uniref:Serine hydrolase n=1 Tax=Virgisporangium ochraceum TaxID=65505 RepID=A0A8J3ZJ25_9ACTN|nr:serine hydrolase domain-containing protein [Virgisporangium ochraceum]GIJ65134.1 serine hydrolase [Virgisporangium ochraceum]
MVKWHRWATAAVGGASTLALSVALSATAVPSAFADERADQRQTGRPNPAVQRGLDGLVRDDRFPGALATVRGRDGRSHTYTAGVSDTVTKRRVPADGRVRLASNTKAFTAVVVLQLVGEGRVGLDEPVETYLPGVVRGPVDGRGITVRHLLQHTSGIADYDEPIIGTDYFAVRHRHFEPRDLVDAGLAQPAVAPKGTFSYSNTNYILAGLIAQKVTGRPIGEEITRRVLKPAGLRDTYWPQLGVETIDGPHPHGYMATAPDAPFVDVTEQDTSLAWAAGQLIGTPGDLNRFFGALLDGKLLRAEQLAAMKSTVDAPGFSTVDGPRYGLGIGTFPLSCGGFAWTHGGNAPGYTTVTGTTEDGRSATIAVTALPTVIEAVRHLDKALDTALCA